MIDPRDIRDLANTLSLNERVIEKDYVLGWLLAGIANDPELADSWLFKGGTCLKKVHFETYRFSEDLDFTLRHEEHLDEAFLLSRFRQVSAWLYEQAGIEVPADQLRFEVYTNRRGEKNVEGRIYYRGPLRPPRDLPKIKLDLTSDEVVVEQPVQCRVFHEYADEPAAGIHVSCYSFAEVFAEKVRALSERARPRDLYDVVNLYRRSETRQLGARVLSVLGRKCAFKGIGVPTLEALGQYEAQLRSMWDDMLGHQLPALPPFDSYWAELAGFFEWLAGAPQILEQEAFPLQPQEQVIRAPLGGLGRYVSANETVLETIRFAGANRLVVELTYVNQEGHHSSRLIEPYSLRRTQTGDVVLHADRVDGGHRTYRVDRMLSARVTQQVFVPRYAIELLPGFLQDIPPASSGPRSSAPLGTTPARRRPAASRLNYVYECGLCGKQFIRKSQTSRLNPHKTKAGNQCAGRTALFKGTRF